MSGNRQKTGKDGEQKALSYLIKKNYQIIETNWRHQKCEIDIIAFKNKELVFFEVKTRRVLKKLAFADKEGKDLRGNPDT